MKCPCGRDHLVHVAGVGSVEHVFGWEAQHLFWHTDGTVCAWRAELRFDSAPWCGEIWRRARFTETGRPLG